MRVSMSSHVTQLQVRYEARVDENDSLALIYNDDKSHLINKV